MHRHLCFLFLTGVFVACFVPMSLAQARGAPTGISASAATVDSLVSAGCDVEVFSERVKSLRRCLSASGPSAPETARALYDVTVAVYEIGDVELLSALWNLTSIVASANLPACDEITLNSTYGYDVNKRRMTGIGPDALTSSRNLIPLLNPNIPEHRVLMARAIARVAINYWRSDLPRSIDMLEECLEIASTYQKDASAYTGARAWLGWTLLHSGRHDEARYHLERARDEMDLMGINEPSSWGHVEGTLGDLALLSGDWVTAEGCYSRAAEWNVQKRRVSSTRFVERSLDGFQNVALAELKRGKDIDAWQSLQRYRGLMDKRLRSLDQIADRSPQTYSRVRELRKRVDSNRSLRRQMAPPQTLREIDWPRVLDELEANAELFRLEAAYYAPEVEKTVSLAELQSALPQNYAYIGWLNCRVGDALLSSTDRILDECWIYVVRSRGPIRWIKLWENTSRAAQESLRKPAGDYGGKMVVAAGWNVRLEPDVALPILAKAIAEQEFNPVLPFLEGVDQLVVEFFEDRTAWKPLESLILPDGGYVGDRFDVSYTPTADAFVACRRLRKSHNANVLVVSDPIFDPNAVSSTPPILNWRDAGRAADVDRMTQRAVTNGDLESLKKLPRLRYARIETDCLKRIFPKCRVLSGSDATEEHVRRALQNRGGSRYSIIHFGTHALGQNYINQRHALAVAPRGADGSPANDGLIDGLEIQLEWNLDADLVTLSGCRTLDGAYWTRGEPSGLAGMMLGVGARTVLATSWAVDDLAAARLNVRFYENLTGNYEGNPDGRDGKPMTKSAALSEARRWLRNFTDDNGKKPFAHPVYWSGFILIGNPE